MNTKTLILLSVLFIALYLNVVCVSADFPPAVDHEKKWMFSYLTVINQPMSFYYNLIKWNPYNNIVTPFSKWNPTLLTEFIEYSHERGVAVHNFLPVNCTAVDCLTFKGWANTAFQHMQSINPKYIASMAVGCLKDSWSFYNADYAHYFILMCYDMGWSSNPLAPTSPIVEVRYNVNMWKGYVNKPGKIIMGLPLYSYYANCTAMNYGLFGTVCNVEGINTNPSVGYNGIYDLVNNYPAVSYQELNGVSFANVFRPGSLNVTQFMFDTPANLYQKYIGMGIGGTACWRIDNLVGLPQSVINTFYIALDPYN
ncbi:hypothetical protein PPL_08355 [Heterostelium album PN500]|uniref:GH18 domain-containing protein n=1 Tax=Heterostelium pallidum (strain ATCC 26659 / Pp 5 / PN500) TaxID=670386 RepID=D3BHY7_HETP5|nr:hypothetical protein PPL_08355 [Heterostelium album PN500]EFA78887.1 hypothetical protein PPL_08355 [Heterostelium album PN500]|eukprot:XP_020431011.1 hypothetical protein PPL_08355 [Heterostelium album PN500]